MAQKACPAQRYNCSGEPVGKKTPGEPGHTPYGLSRSSPHTFLAHHRAAISAAVVLADATTILLAAPMSFKLTMWPKMIVGLSTPLF